MITPKVHENSNQLFINYPVYSISPVDRLVLPTAPTPEQILPAVRHLNTEPVISQMRPPFMKTRVIQRTMKAPYTIITPSLLSKAKAHMLQVVQQQVPMSTVRPRAKPHLNQVINSCVTFFELVDGPVSTDVETTKLGFVAFGFITVRSAQQYVISLAFAGRSGFRHPY